MTSSKTLFALTILLIAIIAPVNLAQSESVSVWEYDATFANDWMMEVYGLVRDNNINAPGASRIYAYTAIAMYEGLVNGMPENFSIGGQMEGLPLLPYPEDEFVYDYPSIANASISTVVTGLMEEANASDDTTFDRIDTMREEQTALRLEEANEDVVERSLALGDEIGNVLLDWISTDNYGPTRKLEYEMPTGEDYMWEVTTEGQPALEPFWSELRPFGLNYPEQCNEPIRLDFSTEPGSYFYIQAQEVLDASDDLDAEKQEIARFWLDAPGVTGLPSGHWIMISAQYAEQSEMSLGRAAEMYTLVGMALADAFISAWDQKYEVNLLRPVTYINRYVRRGWEPYVQSPPFPEYPSGHSVASGAAAEVLTVMFGQVAFTDRTPIINGHENVQREFTTFEHAAQEAAFSRLYGGIHYRAAIELGLRQGRCVGVNILNNIRLRSISQSEINLE